VAWTKYVWAAVVALSIVVAPGASVEGQTRAAAQLAAPAQLSVRPGDTIATLSWLAVEGAQGYKVFRAGPGEPAETLIGSADTNEFIALGLDNGSTYGFRVAAFINGQDGALSQAVAVVPASAATEAPAAMTMAPAETATGGTAVAAVPIYGAQGAPPQMAAQPAPAQPSPTAVPEVTASVAAAEAAAIAPVAPVEVAPVAPAPAVAPAPIAEVAPAAPAEALNTEVVEGAAEQPAASVADVLSVMGPAAAIVDRPTLTARPGNRTVTLTWTAVADATSYRVFRTTTSTFSTTPLATVTGTTTTYANTSLTNGTTYTYTVAARNSSGDGPQAVPAAATPVAPPAVPTGVVTTSGDKQVSVSWTAVSGATSYSVYRGTVTNQQTLLTAGVGAPPFLDASVENGPTYFYKITAVNAGGESARSAEATANPTGPPAGTNTSTLAAFRLLRQATWGPRPGDVEAVKKTGAEAFIDAQLAMAPSAYPDVLFSVGTDIVQMHFASLALTSADQLRLRMAWALHKIWVVSGVEINNSNAIVTNQRVLLNHAFGNYRDLMEAVTLNPAMGRYLNMLNSRSQQLTGAPPNENYARELMQLFTLGIPTLRPDGIAYHEDGGDEIPAYSETDVKELARIFTGWTFGDGNPATVPTRAGNENYRVPMEPVAAYHDAGAKTFLGMQFPAGQSARADLTQALDLLFQHPNLGPFVSRQLIKQLVTSNPSPGFVWAIASVFNDNGQGVRGDLAAVVKAILLHPLASEDGPDPGKLSEPLLFTIAQLRALNASVPNPRFVVDWAANMGQRALFPPSVFSYFSPGFRVRGTVGLEGPLVGPEFQGLTTVTAQTRVNFVAQLLAGSFGDAVTIDYTPFESRANDPAVLVDYCSEVFMGTRMPLEMRNEIVTAVRATVASNPLERIRTALYLTLSAALQQID
jgi:uncharacterized protein (DUF1800 family)